MANLILKILAYVPQYLKDFGALVSGPKRFIAQKNITAEDALGPSLVFLGISIVMVVLMTAPLRIPGMDLWTYTAINAVSSLLRVSLYAIALRIAWRLVGGRAPVRSFFAAYAYFFGVAFVILTFFLLIGEGVFKVYAPELHAQVIEAKLKKQSMPDLSGSSVPFVSQLIIGAGHFTLFVWVIVAWGAYRELNGLSKRRSFIALILMGFFGWGIQEVMSFVESALVQTRH